MPTATCGVTWREALLARAPARVPRARWQLYARTELEAGWLRGPRGRPKPRAGPAPGPWRQHCERSPKAWVERCCGSKAPFRPLSRRPRGAARSSWCSWQVKGAGAGARDMAGTPSPAYLQPQASPAFPSTNRPGLPVPVFSALPPFFWGTAGLASTASFPWHPGWRHRLHRARRARWALPTPLCAKRGDVPSRPSPPSPTAPRQASHRGSWGVGADRPPQPPPGRTP